MTIQVLQIYLMFFDVHVMADNHLHTYYVLFDVYHLLMIEVIDGQLDVLADVPSVCPH